MFDKQAESVKKFYDRFAQKYDELSSASLYKKVYDEITWRLIEPYLPKSGVVLDAGGGTGRWAIPIAKKGLKVIIYDISREMLKIAIKKAEKEGLGHLISTLEGDIRKIKFPENTFDFILAEGDPISYCGDPKKAVIELHRVLKPNCYISAGVDNIYSIAFSMLNMENEDIDKIESALRSKKVYIRDLGFHTWAFTPEDLINLFTGCGFEIIKIAGKPILFLGNPQSANLFQEPKKLRKLIEIEFSLCQERSLIGFGGHLHIVARKILK
ncbi:MAG: methyltransferase domain-containing protein [Candidatus Bathyarchaeia archaeon]